MYCCLIICLFMPTLNCMHCFNNKDFSVCILVTHHWCLPGWLVVGSMSSIICIHNSSSFGMTYLWVNSTLFWKYVIHMFLLTKNYQCVFRFRTDECAQCIHPYGHCIGVDWFITDNILWTFKPLWSIIYWMQVIIDIS